LQMRYSYNPREINWHQASSVMVENSLFEKHILASGVFAT